MSKQRVGSLLVKKTERCGVLKIAGVIAEYNPFHNGHRYQIEQIKKELSDATLVVAMSGNFLQRGEPACFDKWTRAGEALQNGADLVVEVPVAACMQPADRFAFGGVNALSSLGVTDLFFGAEHAEYDFKKYAELVADVHGDFKKYDQSYAASFQQAIAQKIGHSVDQPNDLLALSYAKQSLLLKDELELHPVQRIQAGYHETTFGDNSKIASATAIRTSVASGARSQIDRVVPEATANDLKKSPFVSWSDFWPDLHYLLLSQSVNSLGKIYGMAEGIEYRLKDCAQKMPYDATFDEWIKLVKNKRFTYTRLSRLACSCLLGIKSDEIEAYNDNPYVRVLGFNERGRDVLHLAKKRDEIDIFAKVGQDDRKKRLELDYRTGKIYQLKNGCEQDLKRAPLRF